MRLPTFDPRTIPSRLLTDVSALSSLTADVYNRVRLNRALELPHSRVEAELLKRDTQVSKDILRPAAVLILLVETEQGMDVVLSVRSAHLRHHAGQVSFVGGQIEVGETAQEAALREAYEEIGLHADDVEILGQLPIYQTITSFEVTPVVACISEQAWSEQNLDIAIDEVDHVFTVPLTYLLDVANTRVHDYTWEDKSRQFYSVTFGEYFIWGASMAMLRNLDILFRAVEV